MKTIKTVIIFLLLSLSVLLYGCELQEKETEVVDTLEPIGMRANGENTVNWNSEENQYEFIYADGITSLKYVVCFDYENVEKGLISIKAKLDDYEEVYPIHQGGATYKTEKSIILEPWDFASKAVVKYKHKKSNNVVSIEYTETYEHITTKKTIDYSIKGKTLAIKISSSSINEHNTYSGVNLGRSYNTPNPRIQYITYAEDTPVVVVDDNYFYSTYIDRFSTNGTNLRYIASVDNKNNRAQASVSTIYHNANALDETIYLTVSNDIMDCIYLTSKNKSIYRDELTDKVVYDYWYQDKTYNERLEHFSELYNKFGLESLFVIDHMWQRYGYDKILPSHYPANPKQGTNEEFKNYIKTMTDKYKWLVGLHEDYWFMYPDDTNPYWNNEGREKLSKDANGKFRNAWLDPITRVQSYAIRAGEMKYFSDLQSPRIKSDYNTNAVFLDVNTVWGPDHLNQITMDERAPNSKSIRESVKANMELFDSLRNIYKGPLAGEGCQSTMRFDSAYAGYVDAVEREIVGNREGDVIVDYELRYIRPLMANQGMGYPSRFSDAYFGDIVEGDWDSILIEYMKSKVVYESDFPWDQYNAYSVVFGHTGFIFTWLSPTRQEDIIKTYYLFQAIQSQYLDTSVDVEVINYWDGNKFVELSEAIKEGYNFKKSQLYIKYSNGLEIYANFDDTIWEVVLNGNEYILDKNGWAAENKSKSFVQYSSLKDGNRVDYVDCETYTFADGRGNLTDFGSFKTSNMKIVRKDTNDDTVPVISDIQATLSKDNNINISWKTDKNCSSRIEYGRGESFGSVAEAKLDYKKEHIMVIGGLNPGVTYNFRVISEDISGNMVKSEDFVVET